MPDVEIQLRLSQRPADDEEKAAPRTEGPNRRQVIADRLSGKISKEEANYRDAKETETKENCAECTHYLTPGQLHASCRRVAGIVTGTDVCDLFVARIEEGG